MTDIVNTAEIRVVADASGVEAGLRPAIDAAQRAERAISNIGSGSARSQQNLIQSIQRTTAEMEAGSRTGARYFEVLAQQRGIDPGVLQPYLQQLRAVQQANQDAGQSAGQTRAAIQQIPAQMTDIITSLQGGMEPLTVLIQQGGQIRDAFGGVGPAARALGGQLMGLINPFTVAAAAAAVLSAAYYAGSQEADLYRKSILLTGNAAGTSVDNLADMAQAISKVGGTQSAAAEALAAMVNAGNIPAERLQQFATVAIGLQKTLGLAVADTAQEFSDLGEKPSEAVERLNDKYHFLTAAVYAQIRALEQQGKTEEAGELAQNAYSDAMESRSKKVVENLGYIESRWKELRQFASNAWDAMLGVGRKDTTQDELNGLLTKQARMQKNIADFHAGRDTWGERSEKGRLASVEAEIAAKRALLETEKTAAKAGADRQQREEARMNWDRQADAYLDKKAKRENEITKARNEGAAAGASVAEIEKRIAAIREKYDSKDNGAATKRAAAERRDEARLLAELSGVTGSYMEDLSRLNRQYAKGNLSQERYVELVTELISKQPGAKKMIDETAKEMADYAKATTAANEVLDKELDSITKQVQARIQSNEQIGLSKEAIADLEAVQLDAMATRKDWNAVIAEGTDWTGKQSEKYREQAEELRKLAAAVRDGGVRQASADSAKKAEDDWKKAADDIEKSLTDALLRGFESGKGFGQNLVDTVKNMFNTLVLRPIVSAIVNPVTSSLTSALGMGGSVGGEGANGGGALGAVQSATSIYKAFSGGLTGSIGASITAAGNLFGSSAVSAFGSGLSGGSSVAGAANAYAAAGNTTVASSLNAGATVAQYVPAVAVAVASYFAAKTISNGYEVNGIGKVLNLFGAVGGLVNRAFGMRDKEVTATGIRGSLSESGLTGQSYTDWKQDGGWFRSDKKGSDTAALGSDVVKQFTEGFSALKTVSASFASSIGVSADSLSSYAKQFDIVLGKDQAANEKAITDFFTQVGDEMANRLIPGLSQFSKSGEAASATLQRLAADFKATDAMAQMLGKSAAAVFGSTGIGSATARERLIELAGGIDILTQQASAYSKSFLTEAERLKPVSEALATAMSGLGLSAVASRAQFKQVIDSLNLTTEAGAKQYVAMMGLAESFALVHPAAEEASRDLSSYRSALTDAYNAESDALKQTVDRMGSFATSLRSLGKSALLGGLSPLSPQQKYAEARSQFEAVAAAARGGDEKAQDRYQDVYTAFLEASRVVNASSAGYQQDFSYAQAMTEEVARWAGEQVDVGQAQLDSLKASVSGIIDVNKSVLSVRDALLQYHDAMGKNTLPLTAVAPPVNTPIPYSSYGTQDTEALVAEVKALRTEVSGLRADARQQTGEVIQAQFSSADDSAERITSGFKTATYTEKRVAAE